MSATAAVVCLAMAVYFEARDQPLEGQHAVAQVVMNRVADRRWPDNVCDVVFHGGEQRLHRCQFSFYCDGKPDRPYNQEQWRHSLIVGALAYQDLLPNKVEGATHYHATYVLPYWAGHMEVVVRIGEHIFYKES